MATTTQDRMGEGAGGGFLRSYFRAALGRYDVLLASMGINILTLALPIVILQAYDRIIPEESLQTFAALMVGIVLVIIADAFLRGVRNRITNWSGARFEHATARRAIDKLIDAEIDAFEKYPASEHLDRLAAIEPMRDFHSGQGLIALSDLPFVVVFLGLIYAIGGDLVYAPLALAAAAALFAVWLGARLNIAIRERAALDDARYNFVFQVLNGVHTVKGLGMEAQMTRRYQAILGSVAAAVERVAFLSTLGQSMTVTLSNLAMVATAAFGSLMVIEGAMTGGGLVACILLSGRAVQPLMRMIGVWVQSRNLELAEERLDALMTMPAERDRVMGEGAPLERIGEIKLKNVTVVRGAADYPVLSDISMTIPPGAFVALTGPVGGGKSTFLDLMCGFVTPDLGRLTFDGKDAKQVDPTALRRHVGYAKQEAVLYRGDIADNLSFFRGRADLAAALEVAHKLGLDAVIARLPKGLRTPVGDTASDVLPGSVQQQISLCRVLASKPDLLLLDEANAAFDLITDRRFRDLIQSLRGEVTTIVITSRPSLLAVADLVVTLDRGAATVREQKAAGSVIARNGEGV